MVGRDPKLYLEFGTRLKREESQPGFDPAAASRLFVVYCQNMRLEGPEASVDVGCNPFLII